MIETIDTNSQFNDDIPDGTYDFEVEKVFPKDIVGKRGYEWHLDYVNADGHDVSGKVLLWPNQMQDLLRLLGCREESKGKFSWDPELMVGKTFKATTHHPTTKNGKVVLALKDFKASARPEDVPFG